MTIRRAWGSAAVVGGGTLASDIGILQRARMELAYFSGYFRLKQRQTGGAGVILRFERVRPRRAERFQPNRWHEITPQFLDRTIRALKRWKFDLVSMDEVCRRAVTLPTPNRFVSLTFDGGCKDVIASAYPVLSKHGVPFTVYLPTAFPDGLGEAWWLALEDMIARESRISLVIDRKERQFSTGTTSDKYQTYEFLGELDAHAAAAGSVVRDQRSLQAIFGRPCGAVARPSMDWDDLAKLAADPLVTIGSATVNYPVLSNLRDADAQREIAMGKAVAEAAFHRDVRHFAYPFGDRDALRREHVVMAQEAGFRQCGVGDPGRGRDRGLHQSARAAAGRLGRTAAFAAHDARDAVRRDVCAGGADQRTSGSKPGGPAATSS